MKYGLAIVLVMAAACGGSPAPVARGAVVVSAAASLSNVLQDVGRLYEQRTGTHVAVNVGASNTLARQIRAGARVDLFVSADEAQMDDVAAEIVPGTRVDLLRNQLAVAEPEDRLRPITAIADLAGPDFHRIAIGEPSAVPAGVYAREYLERAGLWARVMPRLVPAANVRLALAAVETGSADAAIVYRTDVPIAPHARVAFVVPVADAPPIVYPVAIMRSGDARDAAQRLLIFLQSQAAADVFERAGFVALHHDR
jgi:molybdate transport system substrate-binding protein